MTLIELIKSNAELSDIEKFLSENGADSINQENAEGIIALHMAIQCNREDIVELLINNGADINIKNKDGHTSLYFACKLDNQKIIMLLIGRKDLILTDVEWNNILDIAIASNNSFDDIFFSLLIYKSGINEDNSNKQNLLEQAIKRNRPTIVERLINLSANIDGRILAYARDKREIKELLKKALAVKLGKLIDKERKFEEIKECFESIFNDIKEKNPNDLTLIPSIINYFDQPNGPILHTAIKCGRLDIVELLINNGADRDIKDLNGDPALKHAVLEKSPEILRFLIDKDANINITDKEGRTGLHYAAMEGNLKIIEMFLNKNADINIADRIFNFGYQALHYAIINGHLDAIKYLLANNKNNVNTPCNNSNKTPLHLAMEYAVNHKSNEAEISKCSEILNILINADADVNARDKDGETALYYAVSFGRQDLVELLLKVENINIEISDKNGKTPFDIAVEKHHTKIVEQCLGPKMEVILQTKNNDKNPLYTAIELNNINMVRYLVTYKSVQIDNKALKLAEKEPIIRDFLSEVQESRDRIHREILEEQEQKKNKNANESPTILSRIGSSIKTVIEKIILVLKSIFLKGIFDNISQKIWGEKSSQNIISQDNLDASKHPPQSEKNLYNNK